MTRKWYTAQENDPLAYFLAYKSLTSNLCAGDTCGEVRFRLPMPRIIGGTPATPGDFPWQVMMLRGGRFACGGTIIDEFHVVTAAHCLDE